ncbi:DUF4870 domain-containing protein [Pseudalkalibacillus berkeleyi]|uniref:DUF4870 domain-containing protein n=1 Tax=Pseudalkalibacillus berkeleyi TaxID=1069813 RepID=A0ABS9H4A8_9BACL|nr:DUF4870 domain-containing protein [Pseudalkalibacillus berkeleyi]MCF6138795.1 DUF4870 domain-containing protein [Pseudalkalibacillus berkeleyi]
MTEDLNALSKEEKNWGMFIHLAAFAGYLTVALGFIVGPLILWLMKKDESEYANFHGKEALNFQISFLIYGAISGLLIFVLIGFILLPIVALLQLIFMIIGTIRASEGTYYRYPMTIRFFK